MSDPNAAYLELTAKLEAARVLCKAAISAHMKAESALAKCFSETVEPQWIVNDIGELGVEIGGRCFFLYKGGNIEYETGQHDDGTPMLYRIVGKREFGETCWPLKWVVAGRRQDFYREELFYTPGLSDGKPEDGAWKPLPAIRALAPETAAPQVEGTLNTGFPEAGNNDRADADMSSDRPPANAAALGAEIETPSQFIYKLNAMEHASQADHPDKMGYAAKREAVLSYVAKLERDLTRLREENKRLSGAWTDGQDRCPQCGTGNPNVSRLRTENAEMMMALRESVRFQSHYAALLNDYDGGQRMIFDTAEDWIKRLNTIEEKHE